MDWTNKIPEEDGWYWVRDRQRPTLPPFLGRVHYESYGDGEMRFLKINGDKGEYNAFSEYSHLFEFYPERIIEPQ